MALDPNVTGWLKTRTGRYGTASSPVAFRTPVALGDTQNLGAPDPWDHWSTGSTGATTPTTTETHTLPGTGGGDPYQTILDNDPLYKQTVSELGAQGIQNAQQRAAAIQRYLIQYGQVPDFAGAASGLGLGANALGFLNTDVTPLTKQLADQNTQAGLSVVARLLDQHNRAQGGIQDQLAARGIFRSGATPSLLGQEGLQYKQAGSDAQNSVLDSVMSAINGYVTNQQAIQQQLRQAAEDAYGRHAGDNTDYGAGTHTLQDGIPIKTTTTGTTTRKRVPDPWDYLNHGGV